MLPDLFVKIILTIFLSLFLVFPVYKFIFIISARRYSLEEFELNKRKIKNKALIFSILITIIFSLIYSIKVF